jgi:hypothetical protein
VALRRPPEDYWDATYDYGPLAHDWRIRPGALVEELVTEVGLLRLQVDRLRILNPTIVKLENARREIETLREQVAQLQGPNGRG